MQMEYICFIVYYSTQEDQMLRPLARVSCNKVSALFFSSPLNTHLLLCPRCLLMPVDTALLAEYEAEAETASDEEFSVLDSPSAFNNLSGAKRKRPFDNDDDNFDEEYSADEYAEDNEGRSSANNISEGLAESLYS